MFVLSERKQHFEHHALIYLLRHVSAIIR